MSIVLEPPIIQTPEALVQLTIRKLQERYPNFNPNPADPQYQFFLGVAYMCAETMLLSIEVPEEIIRFIGETVYQTVPEAAVAAVGTTTWEAIDALGHRIPAGTPIILEPEGAPPVAFEVVAEVIIPPGETKTVPGGVIIRAEEPGVEGNVTGTPSVAPIELLAGFKEITVAAVPRNGVEEETLEEYTARVLELAKLIKPQPILPEDFANFVRLLVPGLRGARVLAVDLLELTKPYGKENTVVAATDEERCVTVVPVLPNGEEPSEELQQQAWELLDEKREIDFKPFVGSPTYHTITVNVQGTVLPGYDKAGTESQLQEALTSLLSPENWGTHTPTPGGPRWVQRRHLYYQEVVAVVNSVEGFGHYNILEINHGTSDVELSGIAPLTRPGPMTISLEEGVE